jgi:short-subunit dehydrogenase
VSGFRERYGPWALVAGASVGLGECFARALAARGLHLLLVARRREPLEALAASLRAEHGVEVRLAAADLGSPAGIAATEELTRGLEVGLLVYNAAASAIGPFLSRPISEHEAVVDVNCRAPLVLSYRLGGEMARRGRGGILLMTSLAGGQGGPMVASYAASKAFEIVLAEGLWDELGRSGVDVLACRAGPTRTPGYESSRPRKAISIMEPEPVVEEALRAISRGPVVVAGRVNKIAAFCFERILPRRFVIRLIGRTTRQMYE